MYVLLYSFSQQINSLSTYYKPSTTVDAGNLAVKKFPITKSLTSWWRDIDNKESK